MELIFIYVFKFCRTENYPFIRHELIFLIHVLNSYLKFPMHKKNMNSPILDRGYKYVYKDGFLFEMGNVGNTCVKKIVIKKYI